MSLKPSFVKSLIVGIYVIFSTYVALTLLFLNFLNIAIDFVGNYDKIIIRGDFLC